MNVNYKQRLSSHHYFWVYKYLPHLKMHYDVKKNLYFSSCKIACTLQFYKEIIAIITKKKLNKKKNQNSKTLFFYLYANLNGSQIYVLFFLFLLRVLDRNFNFRNFMKTFWMNWSNYMIVSQHYILLISMHLVCFSNTEKWEIWKLGKL